MTNTEPMPKALGNHRWLHGNFSRTDEQMRRLFRAKHGREPEFILRWNWWVYAGPEPEKKP